MFYKTFVLAVLFFKLKVAFGLLSLPIGLQISDNLRIIKENLWYYSILQSSNTYYYRYNFNKDYKWHLFTTKYTCNVAITKAIAGQEVSDFRPPVYIFALYFRLPLNIVSCFLPALRNFRKVQFIKSTIKRNPFCFLKIFLNLKFSKPNTNIMNIIAHKHILF